MPKSYTLSLNIFLNKSNLCMFVVQNERWVTGVIFFPGKQILSIKEIIHYKLNIFLFISVRDHWNASYSGLYFA